MPSHYGHNELEPKFQLKRNTLKPRDKTVAKKQVTEGIDQEKAQKRGEKEPKLVRKAVTAAVAQPPPAKRNQLLEKAKVEKKGRHITPAMHQEIKESLASVKLDEAERRTKNARESVKKIIKERERLLGRNQSENILSEWDRLSTEPVLGDAAAQKRQARVRELQRMYHNESSFVFKNRIPKSRNLAAMEAPRIAPAPEL